MGFRYDIGVLRALAVIIVVLFHLHIPFFQGGFIGVDVFFVISGFLMTSIIFKGFENHNFNYFNFINKRAKRIIPALFVMVVFFAIIAPLLVFGTYYPEKYQKDLFYGLTFTSNIFFWLQQNYFDLSAHENIFLNSWSLSLEWQFYMLYPLGLLLLKKIFRIKYSYYGLVLLALTIFSFIICVYIGPSYTTFNFYMLPSRIWEMSIGGVAFFYSDDIRKYISKTFAFILSYSSFLLILLAVIFINKNIVWPSAWTLVPTICTFIIIVLNVEIGWFHNKVIQFVGNISYSLYLWHWPICVLFGMYYDISYSYYFIIPLVLSFIFSVLSYYIIEKRKITVSKWLWSGYVAGIVLIGFIINSKFSLFNNDAIKLVSISNKPYFKKVSDNERVLQFNPEGCFITRGGDYEKFNNKKCLTVSQDQANVILVGDSHSAQYSASFRKKLNKNINFMEISAGFTFPFIEPRGDENSVNLIKSFYSVFLPKHKNQIHTVIFSVHWLMLADMYTKDEIKTELKKLVEVLEKEKINYFFIGQSESYNFPYPKVALWVKDMPDVTRNSYLDTKSEDMNSYMKSIIPQNRYLDIYNYVTKQDNFKNNDVYMFDDNHFSRESADQIVDYIIREKLSQL